MTFRPIAVVAEELGLQQHVLRFWEGEFGHLRPMRSGRRRYYRPEDVDLIAGIRALLYDRGLTLDGLCRTFQERGPAFVRAVGRNEVSGDPANVLAAGLALADLPPNQQAALLQALTDPATCRALADQCVTRSHRTEAANA